MEDISANKSEGSDVKAEESGDSGTDKSDSD